MNELHLPCDQCGTLSANLQCGKCGRDLRALWLPFRVAVPLARRGWQLLLEGDVERARDHLQSAHHIVGGEQSRTLLAWAELLSGNVQAAFTHWNSSPPNEAYRQIELFNRAFGFVERGAIDSALEVLSECDSRFLPARVLRARLRAVRGEELGFESSTVQVQGASHPRSSSRLSNLRLASAAVVVLLFGVTSGWLYGHRSAGPIETRPESSPVVVSDISEDATEGPALPISLEREAVTNLMLASFQAPGIDTALPFGPLDIGPEPIGSFSQQVPSDLRAELGRSWYLAAVLEPLPSQQRIDLLIASVALVGAAASDYWIDDALYEAMLVFQERDTAAASHFASLLNRHHPESIFINSVTQDLLRE